jgi:hypothetical protein
MAFLKNILKTGACHMLADMSMARKQGGGNNIFEMAY